jgi:hypothetical protein
MKFKIFNASEFLRTNPTPNLLKEIELECKPSIDEYIKFNKENCKIKKIVNDIDFIELYISIPSNNKIDLR